MPSEAPRLLSQLTHDLPEDGQLVVYDSHGEKLVVLNDIGAAIYLLIDGERTTEQIGDFVATTLPQKSVAECRNEVENFLKNLAAEGIIEWRGLDSAPL